MKTLHPICIALPLLLGPLAVPTSGWDTPPDKEVTLSGSIVKVEKHHCKECNCTELTAIFKTDKEKLWVRLGPASFFAERDFYLSEGDMVEVVGIRFREKGREVVLANEVRRGTERILLRGKFGRPMWVHEHRHTCPKCAI